MKAREYGIFPGTGTPGPGNKISDVPGVTVGHATIRDEIHNTGVTVILPSEDNMFQSKLIAASFVQNGFGKTTGLVQIDELGTLETPIALTNTLNVGIVADALTDYMLKRCANDGIDVRSINPVVGECNDGTMNEIKDRAVRQEHVYQAIQSCTKDFAEGCVGAGTGTICHGLKGGIGSSSRILNIAGNTYTLGVLVQCNHGRLDQLTIAGDAIGRRINEQLNHESKESDQGSIMMILATDLPVSDRQLRRIIKRCAAGLARLGSYFGHGSGDVMIGFSTANRITRLAMPALRRQTFVCEEALESAFHAAADATEEAVLNALCEATGGMTRNGQVIRSLPEYLERNDEQNYKPKV